MNHNNYKEIAYRAIKDIVQSNPEKFADHNMTTYMCAYRAAELMAQNWNKAIDDNYIQYLEELYG